MEIKPLRRFECQLCPYGAHTNKDLQKHVSSVHDKVKAHVCNECGNAFSRKETLKVHVKMVHLKIKDHVCQECGAAHSQLGDLERHKKRQHSNSCEDCGANFAKYTLLKAHVRSVHAKYVCETENCGLNLPDRASFKEHKKNVHHFHAKRKLKIVALEGNTSKAKGEAKLTKYEQFEDDEEQYLIDDCHSSRRIGSKGNMKKQKVHMRQPLPPKNMLDQRTNELTHYEQFDPFDPLQDDCHFSSGIGNKKQNIVPRLNMKQQKVHLHQPLPTKNMPDQRRGSLADGITRILSSMRSLHQRFDRLEKAVEGKFSTLSDRMDVIESNVVAIASGITEEPERNAGVEYSDLDDDAVDECVAAEWERNSIKEDPDDGQ